MTEETAVPAFWDWVAGRIAAATVLPVGVEGVSLLTGVRFYDGEVAADPVTRKFPAPGYFILGSSVERSSGFYNGETGVAGRYTIHCWHAKVTDAVRLYQWLKRLLLSENPTLEGHTAWDLSISKGNEAPDPELRGWQVPMLIDVDTLQAA